MTYRKAVILIVLCTKCPAPRVGSDHQLPDSELAWRKADGLIGLAAAEDTQVTNRGEGKRSPPAASHA